MELFGMCLVRTYSSVHVHEKEQTQSEGQGRGPRGGTHRTIAVLLGLWVLLICPGRSACNVDEATLSCHLGQAASTLSFTLSLVKQRGNNTLATGRNKLDDVWGHTET